MTMKTASFFRFVIKKFKSVPSTNTLLLQAAKKSAKEGLVYRADFQTKGRGKAGNSWISAPGENLLFSVLLRPPIPPNRAPILTQIACRAIAKVLLDRYKISSTFKRPNDILAGGKKICGVLTEAISTSAGKLEGVVIGIGLNVNAEPGTLPREAVSMKAVLGKYVDSDLLFQRILKQLKDDSRVLYTSPT